MSHLIWLYWERASERKTRQTTNQVKSQEFAIRLTERMNKNFEIHTDHVLNVHQNEPFSTNQKNTCAHLRIISYVNQKRIILSSRFCLLIMILRSQQNLETIFTIESGINPDYCIRLEISNLQSGIKVSASQNMEIEIEIGSMIWYFWPLINFKMIENSNLAVHTRLWIDGDRIFEAIQQTLKSNWLLDIDCT